MVAGVLAGHVKRLRHIPSGRCALEQARLVDKVDIVHSKTQHLKLVVCAHVSYMQVLNVIHNAYRFCIQPAEPDYFEVKCARLYREKLEIGLTSSLMLNAQVFDGRLAGVGKYRAYVEP